MGLIGCVSKVLDLPPDVAIKEAESKLQDTIMFVNGELNYVGTVCPEYMLVGEGRNRKELHELDVTSLDVWVPKTGVYFNQKTGQPIFLQRRPVRQWRRSFNATLYSYSYPTGEAFPIYQTDPTSHKDFWVAKDGKIFYMLKEVGHVKNSNTIVCNAEFVADEMRDWAKGTRDGSHP